MPRIPVVQRLLDLGPKDDPRKVRVQSTTTRISNPILHTPGARIRIARTPWHPQAALALLHCARHQIPVEVVEVDQLDQAGAWIDQKPVSWEEIRLDRVIRLF